MKNNISKYIASALILASVFAGCQEFVQEPIIRQDKGHASLTIAIDMPVKDAATKSIASDPRNNGGTWTDWEKFVDASLLYNFTLFVIDENNTLVAYRNIMSGSDDINATNGFYASNAVDQSAVTGEAVKVTFSATEPLHGNVEILSPGNYKLIAVANYAPIEYEGNVYAGLGVEAEDGTDNTNGSGDFNAIISDIISSFDTSAGIADFDSANHQDFFTYTLNSGEDRVCKLRPQPLVMIRNITLEEGDNSINGMLSRTFARIRLEAQRNDLNDIFSVHKLEFKASYASQKAYLFNDVAAGTGVNLYDDFDLFGTINEEDGSVSGGSAGSLDVYSEDCIIPASAFTFSDNETISHVLVDCYLLEGMVKADYAFSFTTTYWEQATSGSATQNYMITSFTDGSGSSVGITSMNVYIHDESSSSGWGSSLSHYLLYANREGVYSTDGTMETSGYIDDVSEGADLDPEYIWRINLIDTDGYPAYTSQVGVAYGVLESIGTGLYLQPYDGSADMTPKISYQESELIFKINFSGQHEIGTVFCKYGDTYYYLDSSSDHVLSWVEYTGTEASILTASSSSSFTSSVYQMLTFSTIGGSRGTTTQVPVEKEIVSVGGGSTGYNEVSRNQFFHGIIPVGIQ